MRLVDGAARTAPACTVEDLRRIQTDQETLQNYLLARRVQTQLNFRRKRFGFFTSTVFQSRLRPMKFTALLSALLFSGISARAEIPGAAKLEVLKNKNGQSVFGLQYVKRPQPVVAISFLVRGNQLVGTTASPIAPAYWAIMNKETGALITSWVDTKFGIGYISPDVEAGFSLSVEGDQAASFLSDVSNIRTMALVLSLKNPTQNLKPTVYLDLGDLCNSDPDEFSDLDQGRSGCSQ
jgi:hypothetical protein